MPDIPPEPGTRSYSLLPGRETGWPERSLSAKFILVLAPVFIVVALIGTSLLSDYDTHKGQEELAVRIGNQTARVATALGSHHATALDARHARDMMSILFSNPAIQCLEIRENSLNLNGHAAGNEVTIQPTGRLLFSLPTRNSCARTPEQLHLTVPVEAISHAAAVLTVIYSDAEINAAARARRDLDLVLVAAAFVIALLSALIALRLSVLRPLSRLYNSIRHAEATGERHPVPVKARDQIGTITAAFNEMLEREEAVEEGLARASDEIATLNQSLEGRVRKRTEELAQSEQRLTALIESFSSGIYIHRDFKPLYANSTLLDMLGYENSSEFLALASICAMRSPAFCPMPPNSATMAVSSEQASNVRERGISQSPSSTKESESLRKIFHGSWNHSNRRITHWHASTRGLALAFRSRVQSCDSMAVISSMTAPPGTAHGLRLHCLPTAWFAARCPATKKRPVNTGLFLVI